MAKLAVEVMIVLFGTLTLWLGFLRIAEKAGLIELLARLLGPLFRRLMPEVPAGHPALGLITLNFAANGLGLDNAATPIGLKAMRALQELNPLPSVASNAQILFLVLNTSSLTLLPVSIFMYRVQQGANDRPWCSCRFCWPPVPRPWRACWQWRWCNACACGTRWCWPISFPVRCCSAVSWPCWGAVGHRAGVAVLVAGQPDPVRPDHRLPRRRSAAQGAGVRGVRRGREGSFDVAKSLLPYLIAMLCAIGALRASGALDFGLKAFAGWSKRWAGTPASSTPCLPRWSSRSPAARRGRC